MVGESARSLKPRGSMTAVAMGDDGGCVANGGRRIRVLSGRGSDAGIKKGSGAGNCD